MCRDHNLERDEYAIHFLHSFTATHFTKRQLCISTATSTSPSSTATSCTTSTARRQSTTMSSCLTARYNGSSTSTRRSSRGPGASAVTTVAGSSRGTRGQATLSAYRATLPPIAVCCGQAGFPHSSGGRTRRHQSFPDGRHQTAFRRSIM